MNKRIYFPNLHGVRFIAALMVIIHHIEQFKEVLGIENAYRNPFINCLGSLGVKLFFVLSGFLITYLLLKEKEYSKTISITNFYIRRILRIWPLYFLVVFLALFVLPHIVIFDLPMASSNPNDSLFFKLILFVFFLPNLVLGVFGTIPFASQTWSIGTEEQFYLIWPWLIKKMHNKYFALIIILFFYEFFEMLLPKMYGIIPYTYQIIKCWNTFKIDNMALGGLAAALLFDKNKIVLKIIQSRILPVFAITLILSQILFPYKLPLYIYPAIFAVLILHLASAPHPIFSLENKAFIFLGNITYGLYMLHGIAIVLVLKFFLLFKLNINNHFIFYLISILLCILIASISYYFFEEKFLKIKKRKFTSVESGPRI